MGRKKLYAKEYQSIIKQKKEEFNKFVETYVPYVPWKKRLKNQLFPKGISLFFSSEQIVNTHSSIYYLGYDSNIPVNGWVIAKEYCKKYHHNEVLTLLHLYISKVYSNTIPIRTTRSYSTKYHNILKMNLSNESNKTHLLMSILSNEIREYLNDIYTF